MDSSPQDVTERDVGVLRKRFTISELSTQHGLKADISPTRCIRHKYLMNGESDSELVEDNQL